MRAFYSGREHSALEDISAERIAECCKVHISTARRWKRGEEPPFAALQWIQLCIGRDLGVVDPDFAGWSLRHGKLISPEGFETLPGDILSLPFLRRLIAHYQAESRFPRQADWISETWEPAAEIVGN